MVLWLRRVFLTVKSLHAQTSLHFHPFRREYSPPLSSANAPIEHGIPTVRFVRSSPVAIFPSMYTCACIPSSSRYPLSIDSFQPLDDALVGLPVVRSTRDGPDDAAGFTSDYDDVQRRVAKTSFPGALRACESSTVVNLIILKGLELKSPAMRARFPALGEGRSDVVAACTVDIPMYSAAGSGITTTIVFLVITMLSSLPVQLSSAPSLLSAPAALVTTRCSDPSTMSSPRCRPTYLPHGTLPRFRFLESFFPCARSLPRVSSSRCARASCCAFLEPATSTKESESGDVAAGGVIACSGGPFFGFDGVGWHETLLEGRIDGRIRWRSNDRRPTVPRGLGRPHRDLYASSHPLKLLCFALLPHICDFTAAAVLVTTLTIFRVLDPVIPRAPRSLACPALRVRKIIFRSITLGGLRRIVYKQWLVSNSHTSLSWGASSGCALLESIAGVKRSGNGDARMIDGMGNITCTSVPLRRPSVRVRAWTGYRSTARWPVPDVQLAFVRDLQCELISSKRHMLLICLPTRSASAPTPTMTASLCLSTVASPARGEEFAFVVLLDDLGFVSPRSNLPKPTLAVTHGPRLAPSTYR
ncbi:hypothetical protein C8R45DRAFT_1115259 [Mycena sanguinolenta]|nr:hypothetical protein C8R45DRAFT_1115259 [Mycena sanguinolenta]